MLAAGLKGIEDGLELQPPTEDQDLFCLSRQDLRAQGMSTLPESLGEAVELSAASDLMRETLGEHIHAYLVNAKRADWNAYQGFVTQWSAIATWGCCSHARWKGGMMQRKTVIFVADSLDNAHKFQQVLSGLDVDVAAGSSLAVQEAARAASELRSGRVRGARGRAFGCGAGRAAAGGGRIGIDAGHRRRGPAGRIPPARPGEGRLRRAWRQRGRVRLAHPPASVAGQRGVVVRLSGGGQPDHQPGHLPGEGGRRAARPHVSGICASGLSGHASGAHVLAGRASAPRLGLRLLRRLAHRRRARPPACVPSWDRTWHSIWKPCAA